MLEFERGTSLEVVNEADHPVDQVRGKGEGVDYPFLQEYAAAVSERTGEASIHDRARHNATSGVLDKNSRAIHPRLLPFTVRGGFSDPLGTGSLVEKSSKNDDDDRPSRHCAARVQIGEGVDRLSYPNAGNLLGVSTHVHNEGRLKSVNSTVCDRELSEIIEDLFADRPDLLDKLRPDIDDETTSCILTEVHMALRLRRMLDSLLDGEHDSQGRGSYRMPLADDTTYYHGDMESYLRGLPAVPSVTSNVSAE